MPTVKVLNPDTLSTQQPESIKQYFIQYTEGRRVYSCVWGFMNPTRDIVDALASVLSTVKGPPRSLFSSRVLQAGSRYANPPQILRERWENCYTVTVGCNENNAAACDARIFVTFGADGVEVSAIETPVTEPPAAIYLYEYAGSMRFAKTRRLPWETLVAVLPLADTLDNITVRGDGGISASSPSIRREFPVGDALLEIDSYGEYRFGGYLTTAELFAGWNIDAKAIREAHAIRVGTTPGSTFYLARGVAPSISWRRTTNHTHRLTLRFRDSSVSYKFPVLTRPTTAERFQARCAEVSGLSVETIRELATIIPELGDPSLILTRHGMVCECGQTPGTCSDCRYGRHIEPQPERRSVPSERDLSRGWFVGSPGPLQYRGQKDPKGLSRYIGVEIETASTANYRVANQAIQSIQASAVHDGSIPSTGIEIVTMPARGQQFRDDIETLCSGLREAGTRTDKSCGVHVHVDARDLDFYGIQRLTRIWQTIEPAMYDLVAHSRRGSSYARECGYKYDGIANASTSSGLRAQLALTLYSMAPTSAESKRRLENQKRQKYIDSRYFGLNLHSWFLRRTVEFRHHQGSLDSSKIVGWAEICAWVIQSAASMSTAQISAWKASAKTPQSALLALLPKALRTFAKRRSTVLARHRPGYVKPAPRRQAPIASPPEAPPEVGALPVPENPNEAPF